MTLFLIGLIILGALAIVAVIVVGLGPCPEERRQEGRD